MWPTVSYGIVLVAARPCFRLLSRGAAAARRPRSNGGAAISKDNAKDQRRVSHLSALAWRMAAQRSSISSSITWLIGAFSAVRSKRLIASSMPYLKTRVW